MNYLQYFSIKWHKNLKKIKSYVIIGSIWEIVCELNIDQA